MSFVPARAGGLDPDDELATSIVDGEIEEQRDHHLVRMARWRAAEIAERVFGEPLGHRWVGTASAGGFRGLLEFEVSFDGLADHRARETEFVRAVRGDEILGRLPLVYLFTPVVSRAG